MAVSEGSFAGILPPSGVHVHPLGLAEEHSLVYPWGMRLSPRRPVAQDLGPAVDDALAALSREQLAACLRTILAGTPEPDRRELQSSILAFAVRSVPLWRPPRVVDDTLIAEIDAFLKETRRRTGDPAVLSTLMERVDQAFLAGEYALVRAAHERLLPRVLEWSFRF